ncbi:hypothetical protein GQ55_2G094100 [Panicum hallii var. hallii]|uniref:Uncharacterized protein n=1 Tax=Panicum hallii var. hallii TaxID=1504633 RepID=A0A2T7EN62_9POAL|nr:hypothetical protein GQ55_2G094100 [Panicum hallii var. hallii]
MRLQPTHLSRPIRICGHPHPTSPPRSTSRSRAATPPPLHPPRGVTPTFAAAALQYSPALPAHCTAAAATTILISMPPPPRFAHALEVRRCAPPPHSDPALA